MGNFSKILMAGIFSAGICGPVAAQVTPTPLSQAQARLACGNGIVLGAVTLPNGSIEVTCETQASGGGQVPAALAGALTPEIAAVAAVTVVVIAIVAGDDDTTTTTTQPKSVNNNNY